MQRRLASTRSTPVLLLLLLGIAILVISRNGAKLAKSLPNKATLCVDKITSLHALISKRNPKTKAFVEITPIELALQRAQYLDTIPVHERGTLHCFTAAIKDNVETSTKLWGLRTTAGSQALLDLLPANEIIMKSAPAIVRLESEGIVIMGKANMDDFALQYHTYSTRIGQTRNGLDSNKYPGGSSGGSAVACALNLVDFAIGTDTGGSIRIPSAFHGIVGLRPTQGLISTEGVIPLSNSRDTIGPMARKVDTVRRVFQVMASKPCKTALEKLSEIKLGVLMDYFENEQFAQALERIVNEMQVDNLLPEQYPQEANLAKLKKQSKSASMYEFQSNLEAYLQQRRGATAVSLDMIIESTRLICSSKQTPACDFVVHSLERKLASAAAGGGVVPSVLERKWKSIGTELRRFIKDNGYHALVIPAVSVKPTKLSLGKKQEFCPNNRLASLTGLPSLVVNVGYLSRTLPIALELIGLDECTLFGVAQRFEDFLKGGMI